MLRVSDMATVQVQPTYAEISAGVVRHDPSLASRRHSAATAVCVFLTCGRRKGTMQCHGDCDSLGVMIMR